MSIASIKTPGLTKINVNNTVYVDYTYGSDSRGICERLDRPFKTKFGALAAIATFYTGLDAPSASNRVLIYVYPGYSNEQVQLVNFIDWDFNDGVIEVGISSSNTYCLDDYGFQVDSVIYGQATFIANGISGQCGCIKISNANSVVKVDCNELQSSDTLSPAVIGLNGSLTVTCNFIRTTGDNIIAIQSQGTAYLQINLKGSDASGYSLLVTGANCIAVYCQDNGSILFNANAIYAPNNSDGLYYSADGGEAVINAKIFAGRFGNVHNGNGTCTLLGDIVSFNVCVYGLTGAGVQIAKGNLQSRNISAIVGNNNFGKVQLIYSPQIEMQNSATDPIINGPIGVSILTLYRCKIFTNNTCLTGLQVVNDNTTVVDCTIVTQPVDPAFTTPILNNLRIIGLLFDNNAGTGTYVIGFEITDPLVS